MDMDFYRNHWYARIYEQQETQTEDIAYILSTIGPAPQKVLEVACGGGRILEPLARAGYQISGIDVDQFMLEKCRARLENLPDEFQDLASCRYADAVKDDWGSSFDVVIMGGNLLVNIVSDLECREAQRLFIQKAAAALKPGGRLFFNCLCSEVFTTSFDPEEYTIFEGTDDLGTWGEFLLFDQQDDGPARTQKSMRRQKIITKDGLEKTWEWEVTKHFPSYEELSGWLTEAGLDIESACGDFEGGPMTADTDWAIIWAKKNK